MQVFVPGLLSFRSLQAVRTAVITTKEAASVTETKHNNGFYSAHRPDCELCYAGEGLLTLNPWLGRKLSLIGKPAFTP
jgi:hypothetical protein